MIKTKRLKKYKNIFLILLSALIIRILISFFGTLELDFNTFVAWSRRINEIGFSNFYNTWSDYLPGYLYVLWILGKLNSLSIISSTLLYKLPAILADISTGLVIYLIVKRYKDEKAALVATSLYVFNPAVFANSSLWGQVDSLTSLFSILSLWLININPVLSAISLSLGTAIKPQAALTALVILFVIIRDKWSLKKGFIYVLISILVFILLFVPFAGGSNLPAFIHERLLTTLSQYPYTSINAFNFWGLFGFWVPDSGVVLTPGRLGVLFTLILSLVAAKRLWRTRAGEYYLLALIYVLNFMFFTRMHERHLLPALAPLAIVSVFDPYYLISYIGFSVTYVLNLYYSFVWITQDFREVFSEIMLKLVILTNLGLFIYLYTGIASKKINKASVSDLYENVKNALVPKTGVKKAFRFKKIELSKKAVRSVLIAILAFSIITRLVGLAKPESEYFDEVYHAFTAKIMLRGDPKAWEWWNPHPEGFAYEWTHPPLAKEGMVLGMIIFGERSLGWRLPGAILGVGVVFLIYLIAKYVFKDEALALLSAAIYALDGLPIVMSRIGMNDSYLLFFILLSIYLYLKDRNFLSALSFGLALSSKWSAVWAVPIFVASYFVFKKKLNASYVWFFVIPPLVYLASYIPMFLTGHDFNTFVNLQKQMWWYHTRLDATHPFTSPWYSWPFLARPIWLYTKDFLNGKVANIYAMGNPIIFWTGVVSIVLSAYFAIIERSKKLGWVVLTYFVFFIPWALSPRIMFLYHYLPSIPFMAITIGYILRRFPKLIMPTVSLSLIAFFYFYPRWVGLQINKTLDASYHWFKSW